MRESLSITLDSPPGMTRPSTSSSSLGPAHERHVGAEVVEHARVLAEVALQGEHADAGPADRSRDDSLRSVVPAALGEAVRRGEVGDVDADHRLAEPARHVRDHRRVVVERRRLHDRGRALRGVARLEDAGADEDAVGAELHHHRGIRRGGHAARGEQHDGQLAGLGDLGDELVGRLQLLRRDVQLVLGHRLQRVDLAGDLADVLGRLGDVAGAGLALRADHRRALVDAAQRLAEVGRTADERDGEAPTCRCGSRSRPARAPRTRRCSRRRAPAAPAPRRSARCGPWP